MSRGAGRGNSGEQVSLLILLSKPPQAPSGRLSLGPEPRLSPSLIAPLATCPAPPLPVPRHQGDDAHHLGVAMGRGPDSQTPPPPAQPTQEWVGGPSGPRLSKKKHLEVTTTSANPCVGSTPVLALTGIRDRGMQNGRATLRG